MKLALLFFIFFIPMDFADSDWVLERNKDGIQVWLSDEEDFYRVRAQMTIEGELQDFQDLFEDYNTHYNWSDRLKKIEVLDNRGNEWTLLLQFKTPFPLQDRYQLIECRRIRTTNSLTYTTKQSTKTTDQDYGVRMVDVEGKWQVKKLENGKIEITQTAYADPKISLPKSWAKDKLVNEIFGTFKSIEKIIEK